MSTPQRLSDDQYRNPDKFNARVYLHSKFRTNPLGWPNWLFDQLNASKELELLELGCGTGLIWLANARRIPANWKLVLSDASPGMVEETQRKLRGLACRVECAVIDAQEITFPDQSFDAVVANNMLYHVPDRDRAFAEVKRVLRPHGTFHATTASVDNLAELKALMREFKRQRRFGGPETADPSLEPVISGFCLENGAAQLRPHFRQIELRTHLDSLEITEVEAIVNYFLSLNDMHEGSTLLPEAQVPAFRAFVTEKMLPYGRVTVSKKAGMFVCQ